MKDEGKKIQTLNKEVSSFNLHPSTFIPHPSTFNLHPSSLNLHPSSFILQKGFTLLEVLVALAVISGLLVTLIYTVNYQLGIVGRQETVTIATLLAKSTLTELEKKPESRKGQFESPYEAYSYETSIGDSPYPGVSEISVVVSSGGEEVRLNEFIFRKS